MTANVYREFETLEVAAIYKTGSERVDNFFRLQPLPPEPHGHGCGK